MSLRTVFQQIAKSSTSSLAASNLARAYSGGGGRYLNQIQLLGRVGAEPRKIGANEAVAFPLFTESSVKLKDGTSKVYSCWHKVLFVKKTLGEVVFNNVDRGQRVFLLGRIAYKAPEVVDGKLFHSHQAAVIADQIIFLEKSKKNADEVGEEKESLAA